MNDYVEDAVDALTLVMPLTAKQGLSHVDFYDYWLNAHATLPPRFPGIDTIWLHIVSFDHSMWPNVPGVTSAPDSGDAFLAVPEAAFRTLDDLATFQAASAVQMDDGVNFVDQMLAYSSIGDHTTSVLNPAVAPSPGEVRHLVFLQKLLDVELEPFRHWVAARLAPALAAAAGLTRLRRHLFEPLEVTLDHPGTVMEKPAGEQYHAMIDVTFTDEVALNALASSELWSDLAAEVADFCKSQHAPRVTRCVVTKNRGQITLAGIRGVAVADVIQRLGAKNQLEPDVLREFMPPADLDRAGR